MYYVTCFAPDGASVRDGDFTTVDEAREYAANMGSRWIFYPLACITTDKKIIEAPAPFDSFTGKYIATLERYLENNTDEAIAVMQA